MVGEQSRCSLSYACLLSLSLAMVICRAVSDALVGDAPANEPSKTPPRRHDAELSDHQPNTCQGHRFTQTCIKVCYIAIMSDVKKNKIAPPPLRTTSTQHPDDF